MKTTEVLPPRKSSPLKVSQEENSSEPNLHFSETMWNFQVVTHFSLENGLPPWKMRYLALTIKHQLLRSSCHYSSQVATDRHWSKRPPIPARRDDADVIPAGFLPEGRRTSQTTKPGWGWFFFPGGWCCCLFWGGWRFHNPYPKKKRDFFLLSEEIFEQPRGVEVFYCSGPTSPWEWGKVSKSFLDGGQSKKSSRKMRDWTMVAPPRLGYRMMGKCWHHLDEIVFFNIGCLSSQVV